MRIATHEVTLPTDWQSYLPIGAVGEISRFQKSGCPRVDVCDGDDISADGVCDNDVLGGGVCDDDVSGDGICDGDV